MELSPNLLRVLTCPATGEKLIYDKFAGELVSESAGLIYPIIDGIPILLIDKARKIHTSNHKSSLAKESKKDTKVAQLS